MSAYDADPAQATVRGLSPITDPLDQIAAHVDGTFVVIVHLTSGRYRRRCFLTIAAAERHARRAQEAGHSAEIYLAELHRCGRSSGGTVGMDEIDLTGGQTA